MKSLRMAGAAAISAALFFVMIGVAHAQNPAPPIIPVTARIAKPSAAVFASIRSDLSAKFTLTVADPTTGRIVAKRTGMDPDTWTTWAYCTIPAQDMLGDLMASSVTLTITITPAGRRASNVSVGGEFHASYSIDGQPVAAGCVSNNVLENEILDSAGARVL